MILHSLIKRIHIHFHAEKAITPESFNSRLGDLIDFLDDLLDQARNLVFNSDYP